MGMRGLIDFVGYSVGAAPTAILLSIAAGSLPPPHYVGIEDQTPIQRSTIGRMPFHRQPDPTLNPRLLLATWDMTRGEVADAIRRHYDEHTHAVFTMRLPSGELVKVQWFAPPEIQWASEAAAATVRATFEEVTAYE